jgi:endothelin-converting enzyme
MDSERRALLAEDVDADDDLIQAPRSDEGFIPRLLSEPLTELARLLIFVSAGLLLLASVFIGLFAGAEHRLSDMKHRQPSTITESVTTTATATVSTAYTVTMTSIIPPPTRKPDPPRPASVHFLRPCAQSGSHSAH